ncbi:amidohydrolase [Sedimentitalea sp. JM2-8]|uniref:Amidohydrolase n=1 Tax=Sedimentitalea xiamensis TaxID=3050037 RepID=A0ABT7FLB0_9RHOB|nr:amidohydrolase [Sedimentitalea xiamensis]MDK3075947.1 amidohydrolase [Sedimentitalea xiamensis]
MNLTRLNILTTAAGLALICTNSAFAQTTPTPEGGLSFDTGISNRNYPSSDWALINGKIYTVDKDNPWATAIAVEGNRITYVGDAQGLKDQIGIATRVVDLDGKMVLPGFVEGHFHVVAGGIVAQGVDLQTDDKDEVFEKLRQYIADNPDLEVIEGYGVRLSTFKDGLPTKEMFDEIESERPIYLWTVDGHSAFVNSKAFEIAGVDKDTPETVPGYSFFDRDAEGNPTGFIVEVPAQLQVLSALRSFNADTVLEGVKEWLPKFSAAGITTVFDYGVQGVTNEEAFDWLQEREKEGALPVRLQGSYYWNDPELDPIPPLLSLKEKYNSELVKVDTLKINLDGGDEKWNALFTEPYADNPDVKVEPIIPYDVLYKVVADANAQGLNITCHCFGDLAVRKLLDASEAATKGNPSGESHHAVSHAVMVHPDDIPRFGELGVTYDTTGFWMSFDPLLQSITTDRLGADRVQAMLPMKQIAEAGGNISLGSDWPASGYLSEYRPLLSIRTAVTRQLPGRDDIPPLGSEEARIPLDMAIYAQTLGAAAGRGLNDKIGSLQAGKMADMVVLDQNLFEIDPHDIDETQILLTIMNGEVTYDHLGVTQ